MMCNVHEVPDVSVPGDRTTPEAVVVKEDFAAGGIAFFLERVCKAVEVVKSFETVVMLDYYA